MESPPNRPRNPGPADTPAATEEAEESQGDNGGSSGDAPALADGPWTGGQGAVTVSGGVEWSTDEPITTDVSETTDAKTLLAYNSDDTFVTIFINLTGVPFHASVTAPDWDASSDDCEVTYRAGGRYRDRRDLQLRGERIPLLHRGGPDRPGHDRGLVHRDALTPISLGQAEEADGCALD